MSKIHPDEIYHYADEMMDDDYDFKGKTIIFDKLKDYSGFIREKLLKKYLHYGVFFVENDGSTKFDKVYRFMRITSAAGELVTFTHFDTHVDGKIPLVILRRSPSCLDTTVHYFPTLDHFNYDDGWYVDETNHVIQCHKQ